MHITVIHTATNTALTIVAPDAVERLSLYQMRKDGTPFPIHVLVAGRNPPIPVGPGTYKILSDEVKVTSDPYVVANFEVRLVDPKSDPPEQPKLTTMTVDRAALRVFIVDERNDIVAPPPPA